MTMCSTSGCICIYELSPSFRFDYQNRKRWFANFAVRSLQKQLEPLQFVLGNSAVPTYYHTDCPLSSAKAAGVASVCHPAVPSHAGNCTCHPCTHAVAQSVAIRSGHHQYWLSVCCWRPDCLPIQRITSLACRQDLQPALATFGPDL